MADEARVNGGFTITNGNLKYRSHPTSFQVDVSGEKGPTPGALTCTPTGENVDISELTIPGLCEIKSLEQDGGTTFEVGIWDGTTFYPLMEVGPGEGPYTIKLSRNISWEYGTGTGTITATAENSLRVRALDGSTADLVINAFEA